MPYPVADRHLPLNGPARTATTPAAVIPTPRERKLLQLDSGVAAFAIDRLGTVGERAVEWRTTLIRGDRFSVSAEFTARAGYPLQLHSTHHRTDIGRTA